MVKKALTSNSWTLLVSGQEFDGWPGGRREVKTASSVKKDDERPGGRRMAEMERSIERCRVAGRTL